jgi:hypothetical protein
MRSWANARPCALAAPRPEKVYPALPSAHWRRVPDVSATTDAILAAGPTAVALATIGAAIWQQRRGFRHERTMVDLEAIRALLGEAAVALHDADYARYEADQARLRHGRWLAERAPEVVTRLAEVGKSLDRLSERLAVSLGPDHDAVTQFRAANEAVRTVQRELGVPANLVEGVQQHQAIEAANSRFNVARAEFLTAAVKTAGAQLP